MPLGESLAELRRQHHELCRKRFYPKFVESLRNGELERAKSLAGFMRLEIGSALSYRHEARDETAQSVIQEAEQILRARLADEDEY